MYFVVVQLVMDSTEEEPSVTCGVTIRDSQLTITDSEAVTFAVKRIPPGEVRTNSFRPGAYHNVGMAQARGF